MSVDTYKGVCCSGGGVKGICTLGALHYFHEQNLLEPIEWFFGTSVGSAICLLLVCGYSPYEIFTEVFEMETFMKLPNVFEKAWWQSMMSSYGLMSFESIGKKIESMVMKKFSVETFPQVETKTEVLGDESTEQTRQSRVFLKSIKRPPTLAELRAKTGKTLVIIGTNVSDMKEEQLSADTYPDLSCIEAVRISCNIPFLFEKIQYAGKYWVDGGLLNNYPIQQAFEICPGKILGITVSSIYGRDDLNNDNIATYFTRILMLPILEIEKLKNLSNPRIHNLKLEVNSSSIRVSMDKEQKLDVFMAGYTKAMTSSFRTQS